MRNSSAWPSPIRRFGERRAEVVRLADKDLMNGERDPIVAPRQSRGNVTSEFVSHASHEAPPPTLLTYASILTAFLAF